MPCHLGPLHNAVEAGAMIIPLKARRVAMSPKAGDKAVSPQQNPNQPSMGDCQTFSKNLRTRS